MAVIVEDYGSQYQAVANSQTAKALGANGGDKGDYLLRLIIQVATAATGNVSVLDGGTTIFSFAASPGGGIGVYSVPLNIKATVGWKVTTGAGATALAVGNFT